MITCVRCDCDVVCKYCGICPDCGLDQDSPTAERLELEKEGKE